MKLDELIEKLIDYREQFNENWDVDIDTYWDDYSRSLQIKAFTVYEEYKLLTIEAE